MSSITRRGFIRGSAGLAAAVAAGGVAACSRTPGGALVTPGSAAVEAAEQARQVAGRSTVTARLTPRPVTIDIGARTVETWGYGDELPGPLLRATAGDRLAITVDNRLPTDTSVHWHGLALRNDMDSVPHLTQDPIDAGESCWAAPVTSPTRTTWSTAVRPTRRAGSPVARGSGSGSGSSTPVATPPSASPSADTG